MNELDALVAQLVALDNALDSLEAMGGLLEPGAVRTAIESQVRTLKAQVTACIALVPNVGEDECAHESRYDESTIGHTCWTCKDCGYVFDDQEQKGS